ncbi:MAG: DUF4838 domain-containing protein [Armatimonadota bacterium]
MRIRRNPFAPCTVLLATVALAVLPPTGASAGANIYPDPGFEAKGALGAARSGERAGHLEVDAKQHWVALGGALPVEPFATYRVSLYAKANLGEGTVYAPYCYQWDSYVWSFVRTATLPNTTEWRHLETTFVSPHDTMFVHPLALLDCANTEAWVDDVVVEKIASPEETMAQMMAVPEPGASELGIIARYLLGRGELAKAQELLEKGEAAARADVACLLAQRTRYPARRWPFLVAMVRYGGPTYNAGVQRFNEVTAGMVAADRLAICTQAVLADPASALAAAGYRTIVEQLVASPSRPQTTQGRERELDAVEDSLRTVLAAMPADAAGRTEVAAVSEKVEAERRELAQTRQSLGKCKIRIGGRIVKPETHAIVIPEQPTPQEQHAAADLQHHLELVTGKALPVVAEGELAGRTPLVVGRCELLDALGLEVDLEALGDEGIYIGTSGPALALVGNKRGVLYACYTFLEDYVGCRWFAPDCSTWPTKGLIKVPKLDRTYVPPLEYRTTDYPNSRDPDWAVRNKNNGTLPPLDEARGGHITYHHFVHTFNALIPQDQYFDEHPEYFSEINGQRVRGRTQLCLTNPEVIELAKKRVRQWIQERPDATIISVSQNDWHNYCQCDNCSALAEEEGSQAGPLIHFINAIADDIRDDYPHIIIDTLAYQYTRKPPKHVRPSPNVAVRLCSIECCFIHPLATDPYNASFVDDIVGWSKICDRLHIWDYVINYAHTIMPFPNLYVLKPNINFFIEHGVTGIYEEACYYTKGAELAELRTYVMAKTLWDPSYDTDKAIDEFCAAYYGAAAPYVREYIDLVHESAQSIPDMHVRIYSPPSVGYLTPEVLERSQELFDRAEAAVREDPTLLHRVQVARLPLIYSQIALAQQAVYVEQGDQLVPKASVDIPRLAREFERIARAEGLTMVREGGAHRMLDAWLASLPKAEAGLDLKRLRNESMEVSILPQLGGRLWRVRLRPSGRDILKLYGEEGAWDPSLGGYEEYSQVDYRSPGWNEEYAVTNQAERSISLEAKLSSGLKLTRVIELDREEPIIRVVSTLTNTSGETRAACLRIHPAFQVETTQKASVRLLRADGSWRSQSLANAKDPEAESNMWLRGDDRPDGQWTIVDRRADLAVRATFEPDQVEQCLLNWSGRDARVNLELFSPSTDLAPGQSITIEHSYRVSKGAEAARP